VYGARFFALPFSEKKKNGVTFLFLPISERILRIRKNFPLFLKFFIFIYLFIYVKTGISSPKNRKISWIFTLQKKNKKSQFFLGGFELVLHYSEYLTQIHLALCGQFFH